MGTLEVAMENIIARGIMLICAYILFLHAFQPELTPNIQAVFIVMGCILVGETFEMRRNR